MQGLVVFVIIFNWNFLIFSLKKIQFLFLFYSVLGNFYFSIYSSSLDDLQMIQIYFWVMQI